MVELLSLECCGKPKMRNSIFDGQLVGKHPVEYVIDIVFSRSRAEKDQRS